MGNEHEFDRLIDEGARRYVDAEPSLGLENRVLAALEEKRRPVWWQRWWVIAVPALAALALVIGLALTRKPEPSAPVVAQNPTPATAAIPPLAPGVTTSPREPVRTTVRPRAIARPMVVKEARPQQFPSPVAVTEQEKILAQLLRQGHTPVVIAEKHPAPGKDVPPELMEISAVQVQPLPDPNGQ